MSNYKNKTFYFKTIAEMGKQQYMLPAGLASVAEFRSRVSILLDRQLYLFIFVRERREHQYLLEYAVL